MPSTKPILGVTMGDPAGVGPEIIVRALTEPRLFDICNPVVLGDPAVIVDAAKQLHLPTTIERIEVMKRTPFRPGVIPVLALSHLPPNDRRPGVPTQPGALAAGQAIEYGARLALSGSIQGLVTAPINKEAMKSVGFEFPGHTEFLAHQAGGPPVVMMLAGKSLRVVLVTIHESLNNVPRLITRDKIDLTTHITHDALIRLFGISRPRLAMAALNPHAGESGLFGQEEIEIIKPAVNELKAQGLDVTGPLPPDTVFYQAVHGRFDAVVCMYHDQGLIPFKLLHFADGVNTTLGLPFIRTSVDHGTAFDIAGQGKADHRSMSAAIRMAADMAERINLDPS